MPIWLVLRVCLLAYPHDCHEEHGNGGRPYDTIWSCIVSAHTEASRWMIAHPDWDITEILCRPEALPGNVGSLSGDER